MKQYIKPGYFGIHVAADSRRNEFDCKNQVLIEHQTPIDFVFIGDSITERWELGAYFHQPNQIIINRGIGGDITEYVYKRFEADVIQLKPNYCIMMIGVNDAWDLEYDYGKQEPVMTVPEVLERSIKHITQIIKLAKQHQQPLIICSVLPTNMLWTNHETERKHYIKQLNQYLVKLCQEHHLIYVDYYTSMLADDGLSVKEGIMLEDLHPNVFGYDIMADILRTTLKQHNIKI